MLRNAKMQMLIHWLALPFVTFLSLISGCSGSSLGNDDLDHPVIHIQLPQLPDAVAYDVLVNLSNRAMVLSQATIPANSNKPLQVDLRVGDHGPAKVDVYAKFNNHVCASQMASLPIEIDGIKVHYVNIVGSLMQQPAETCLVEVMRLQSASSEAEKDTDKDVGTVVSNGGYIRCEESNMAICYAHVPTGTSLELNAKKSDTYQFSSWRRNGVAPQNATVPTLTIPIESPERIAAIFGSNQCVRGMFCQEPIDLSPINVMDVTFTGVSAAAKNDAWAVGKTTSTSGVVAHYDGTSWKPIGFATTPPTLNDVVATAANTAYVVGDRFIYKCTLSGCVATGITVPSAGNLTGLSLVGNTLWVLDLSGDVHALNLTTMTLDPNYYSHSGSGNFKQISAVDASRAYAVSETTILSCTRGGSISCASSLPPSGNYRGIAALTDGVAWTGGALSTLRRRDGGGTLSSNMTDAPQKVIFSMFYDKVGLRIWAVGEKGYVESWQDGPTLMRADLKPQMLADQIHRLDVFSTGQDTWIVGEQGKIDHYLN